MKVAFQFPAAAEPHISNYDKNNNTVTIEPKFFSQVSTPIGHVSVKGDQGTERKFLLMLSPSSGEPKLVPADQTVTPSFDTVTPEEFKRKRAAQEAQARKTLKPKKKETPPDGALPAAPTN